MPLSNLSNDELATGLRDHLVEAESRASGFVLILLKIAHRALDEAQRKAHEDGQVTTLAGGEKGP
jgi:hypothetical protein